MEKRAEDMLRLRFERKLTLQKIADRYGISRERVRQIIVQHSPTGDTGKVTAVKPKKLCKECGRETDARKTQMCNPCRAKVYPRIVEGRRIALQKRQFEPRVCKVCKVVKPLHEFYKNYKRMIPARRCKDCHAVVVAQWKERNAEKAREINKRAYHKYWLRRINDPVIHERMKQKQRERYRNDPEYRARALASSLISHKKRTQLLRRKELSTD